jgi:hypothetical protein
MPANPIGPADLIGIDRARLILNDAPRAGYFIDARTTRPVGESPAGAIDLNFSSTSDTRYAISAAWNVRTGAMYDEWLHTAIDSTFGDELLDMGNAASGNLRAYSPGAARGLPGKTLLLFGDSTDGNIWSELCHCARDSDAKHSAASVVGETTTLGATHRTECFSKSMIDASQTFLSCRISMDGGNLTVHMAGAEHFVHPWGDMPFGRQQTPACDANDDLASCLRRKLGGAGNALCNLSGVKPDLIMFQSNLWFWFRMQWYGVKDEIEWLKQPWSKVMQSYRNNVSVAVKVLQDMFPSAQLVALHTAVSTPETAHSGRRIRVANLKISHANAAMRVVAAEQNLPLVDWDIMAHRGWSREGFLADDMHAKVGFNRAIATVYLNALAAMPRQSL